MIIGEDYKFRDDLKHDTVPIELLSGPYKGIVLRYTKVTIKEQEENNAIIKFDYDLIDSNKFKENKLRDDMLFQDHIGLILNDMILESVNLDAGC
jgi:hypothetical protein